jgi:hypothetical protein
MKMTNLPVINLSGDTNSNMSPFLVAQKGGVNTMEENTTTLLKELASFNDVPLTEEDREEIAFQNDLREREELEDQQVVAQVLREAGVDIYANDDNQDYC